MWSSRGSCSFRASKTHLRRCCIRLLKLILCRIYLIHITNISTADKITNNRHKINILKFRSLTTKEVHQHSKNILLTLKFNVLVLRQGSLNTEVVVSKDHRLINYTRILCDVRSDPESIRQVLLKHNKRIPRQLLQSILKALKDICFLNITLLIKHHCGSSSPVSYTTLQLPTLEKSFDMNLDLRLGRMESSKILGGLESTFIYMIEEDGLEVNELRAKVTPYLQFLTAGAIWEIRVTANVWPYALDDLIECFLTVKAEF